MAAVLCPPGQPDCGIVHMDPSHIEHLDISTDFFASAHAVKVSKDPPTDTDITNVSMQTLVSEKGERIPFHQLWRHEDRSRRTLIIFVRHFFCGNCQEYLRTLSEGITPQALRTLPQPTEIYVIGCGQPDLIPFYREATNCPYEIYADPSRELYVKLGMARTMAMGEKKPDYVRKSMLGIVASGITQGMAAGRNAAKGGDFWQVGGEFLFEGGAVTHCHRMSTTRDHAEMPELRSWLGLEDPEVDERQRLKATRGSLSELGASMRRSLSRRRSPSRSTTASRKASEASSTTAKSRRESMGKVTE